MTTILIVDDHLSTVELLSKVVSKMSLDIKKAYNGKQAWNIFESCKPGIVISDYKMPPYDGIELTRKIKSQSINTPIILVSGFSDSLNEF